MKYETKRLETKRLIMDKGNSKTSREVYEYDLTKCTGIDNQNELVKFAKPIDFIGIDSKNYYEEECQDECMYDWYIYLKNNRKAIGNVIADREVKKDKAIELSYNMHPNYWNNGYMTEALQVIIDYLKNIGYKKIIINFYEGNIKSKRLSEKLGFKFVKKQQKYYSPRSKMIDNYEYILEL